MLGFGRTYTTPFKEKIPASVDDFFRRVSIFKRFNRFFGRFVYAEITLRNSQKIEQITHKHQKILWIQWVDSYLGDSLMDLSGRLLLKGRRIDLLTQKNIAKIYQNDEIFTKIFSNPNACSNDYDLIIIGSYRQREIKVMPKYLLSIPHVSLYGYYNVDDFNRLYFSFYRFNQLLSNSYDSHYLSHVARPTLPITLKDKNLVNAFHFPDNFITIVVGGANKERIFQKWHEVIDQLIHQKISKYIVLVGLQNAKQEAKSMAGKYPNNIINMVGKCSFNQTAEVIKKSIMLICADGGLLHSANAVGTPVIGLFYYIDPLVRLININPSYGLVDKNNINNIETHDIVSKTRLLKETLKNGQ